MNFYENSSSRLREKKNKLEIFQILREVNFAKVKPKEISQELNYIKQNIDYCNFFSF